MKRYYSHFTYIYPDTFLKNHIVELDDNLHITQTFLFEKEVEKTEFHSGILLLLPDNIALNTSDINKIKEDISKYCLSYETRFDPYDINILKFRV